MKCIDCECRSEYQSIVNDRISHTCNALGKTISYDKNGLPKTSPRWCPLRKCNGRTESKLLR
jgi:hypothetical protein